MVNLEIGKIYFQEGVMEARGAVEGRLKEAEELGRRQEKEVLGYIFHRNCPSHINLLAHTYHLYRTYIM